MEREIRELKRLATGTQDDARAAAYRKEGRTAQKKLKAFVDENGETTGGNGTMGHLYSRGGRGWQGFVQKKPRFF